ncbi:peptidoglycan D,D-transpeptidase FtsI family protein [Natronoglycomyces albus]|uniref:Penicillin-binding protein 2 n=1 Tax=Natronoglycomyces albus TaxID=2811108 RepID=A0A895XK23_9ACTN|nr:penicillin-binding protein 2 [Natronoglycomyces albus]QSB03903.1 penicillin-binding protein 2 [Natronoglycomyces albus]
MSAENDDSGESGARPAREQSSMSRARRMTPRGRSLRDAASERPSREREDPRGRDLRRRAARAERPSLRILREDETGAKPKSRTRDGANGKGGITAAESGKASTKGSARSTKARFTSSRETLPAERRRRRTTAGRGASSGAGTTKEPRNRGGQRSSGAKGADAAPRNGSKGRKPQPSKKPRRIRETSPVQHPRLHGNSAPAANPQRRIRVAYALSLVLMLIIAGRLVHLQVTDAAAYAAAAHEQRVTTQPLPAARGAILDRDGNRLAYSIEANFIAADPTRLQGDPEELAAELGPLLGRPASELVPLLATDEFPDGTPKQFAYLQRGVDINIGKQIAQMDDQGLIIGADERRVVPGHDLAANVIGFTGGDEGEGLAGLEGGWNNWLSGTDGEVTYEQSHSGQPIPGAFYREDPAQPGQDLRLTLDWDLQFQVQKILDQTVEEHDAEWASAVVLEVASGEALAMASLPTFDAANPFGEDEELYRDHTTQATVDPGSVHKAIVIAAALEEGLIERDGSIVVPPTIVKGNTTYSDSYPQRGVPLTLAGIIAQSSNVGTIMLADMLGPEKLYEYQKAFGLGTSSGVGVAGEADGMLLHPDNWSGTSAGSIPIGHEITTTPIQMAAVYATIANDGVYTNPALVQSMIDRDGQVLEPERNEDRRVISVETAEAMQYLLQSTIYHETGTGTRADLNGYHLAGKTGTGGLVRDGEYASGHVASFVGFAPAEDPQFAVAVFAYVPGGGGGGEVTADAFRQINEYALGHYRVAPTDADRPEFNVWG